MKKQLYMYFGIMVIILFGLWIYTNKIVEGHGGGGGRGGGGFRGGGHGLGRGGFRGGGGGGWGWGGIGGGRGRWSSYGGGGIGTRGSAYEVNPIYGYYPYYLAPYPYTIPYPEQY